MSISKRHSVHFVRQNQGMELKQRLYEAMRDANVTKAELARQTGLARSSIQNWLNGRTKSIKGENLVACANALNVSEAWLAGRSKERSILKRDAQINYGYINVPYYTPEQVIAHAGACAENIETMIFDAEWISINELSSKDLFVIDAPNLDMYPDIKESSLVLIDRSKKDIIDAKIFAINYSGSTKLRQLRVRLDGSITITCSNDPDHSIREHISRSAASNIDIIGQVVIVINTLV